MKRRAPRFARELNRAVGQPVRVKARFCCQRRMHRRPFEADEIDVRAVDRRRQRVVLHPRAPAQVPEHNDRSSHVTYMSFTR